MRSGKCPSLPASNACEATAQWLLSPVLLKVQLDSSCVGSGSAGMRHPILSAGHAFCLAGALCL